MAMVREDGCDLANLTEAILLHLEWLDYIEEDRLTLRQRLRRLRNELAKLWPRWKPGRFRNIIEWLRTFPRPWRMVRVDGDIASKGGTVYVGNGVTLWVNGAIMCEPGKDCRFEAMGKDDNDADTRTD